MAVYGLVFSQKATMWYNLIHQCRPQHLALLLCRDRIPDLLKAHKRQLLLSDQCSCIQWCLINISSVRGIAVLVTLQIQREAAIRLVMLFQVISLKDLEDTASASVILSIVLKV